jgi:hypothetical protein
VSLRVAKEGLWIFHLYGAGAPSGPGPTHYQGFTITIIQIRHTRQDSSGRVISPTQRSLPNNTQQSQETDIHVPGGIRTRNPSKRATIDPCLRQRGHWGRQGRFMEEKIPLPLPGIKLRFLFFSGLQFSNYTVSLYNCQTVYIGRATPASRLAIITI